MLHGSTRLPYAQDEFIIPSFNKNINQSLNEYFVSLEIIEQNKNVTAEASWGFEFFSRRDVIPGRRNVTGTLIQVDDIMNYSLNKIAVYGSPGTGKTTLCKKIVYDFYENPAMDNIFDDVIWIQLRRLREKTLKGEDFRTIDELVSDYFGIKEKMLNLEKCLFILDGWDEIHDLQQENIVMELLKEIISNYKVIVTSRPYADLTHITQNVDQILEIHGFDDFNVRKYIKNVLKSGSKLKSTDEAKILDFLSESVITDMMSIPILLDIFLFTWEEIVVTQVSKLTITKLYELIVMKLWNEFIQREVPHRQEISYNKQNLKSLITCPLINESLALSKIASTCFERGNLLFSYTEIDGNNECKDALVKTRFLNGVDANEGNTEWKRYEFIHLTFCEFFTALNYVHYKSLTEFREIIATYKYNITYRIIFGYMAGLISNGTHGFTEYSNEEMLNVFFDCLESEPIDLIRSYHNVLTATCFNECAHALDEKRATEICQDLDDTHNTKLPRITSLAIIEVMIKNQITLTKFIGCRLPNLTDNFFYNSGFSDLDVWSKINVIGSQVSFNEASKVKLRELLHIDNRSDIFNFFTHNSSRIPDFFLIFIIDNYSKNYAEEYTIVQRMSHIKMPLNDSIAVCEYLEPNVSHSDSVLDIITKMILHSDIKITYMLFLKNTYEFMESFNAMLLTIFDVPIANDHFVGISRILYVMAMFNVNSPFVLNKLMEIMEKYDILRPLTLRVIFHLYHNKWLPDDVALSLIKYLHKPNSDVEEVGDEENPYIILWEKYRILFRCDALIAGDNIYALVCDGLTGSNFQPILLDSVIDRLCNGTQNIDDEMFHLLGKRKLTDCQIANLIESKIEFKDKYWLLSSQTHNRNVTAFFACNAQHMFAVDDSKHMYSKIDKDFSESEKEELAKYSAGYERYHTRLTLTEIVKKIIEMSEKHKDVFDACKFFCQDLCYETFQKSVSGISLQKLSEIFQSAFWLPYLSLNQRGAYVAHEILIRTNNSFALDINAMIDEFWNYETSISVLDQSFFIHLADDVLGHYCFKILDNAMLKNKASRAYFIKWINPVNMKHLLTFLIHEITTFKHALYITSSSSSYFRLCSSTFQSHELGTEEISFVYNFKPLTKWLDHTCRQVKKNAVSDICTMDKCNAFYIKVTGVEKLNEISETQYRTDKQLVGFFKGNNTDHDTRSLIKLFKMLYNEKILLPTPQDFDMWWSTFYTLYHSGPIIRSLNFGPYHIDLTATNITDAAIVPIIEKFLADNEKNVHVLVLSNNYITIDGLERLINSIQECEVKHLFLDGNHIYFDKQRFDAFKTIITDPNIQLLTLDLSCNFIMAEWVDQLKSFGTVITNASVKYILINNCRVIYQRTMPLTHQGFPPSIDFIAKMDSKEVPLKITQEDGCVGYVCRTQFLGYSGHVLIFIERIHNGQREVYTAELFQDKFFDNVCKVVIRNVDPFVDHNSNDYETCRKSLKNRLLEYDLPKRGPFPNEIIEKLLIDIKSSQDKDNFYEYNIATKNQFENRNNCIKWANDIMKPLVKFEILEIKIPWFYAILKRFGF